MNIQNLFVIITFSKPIFKQMVTLIGALPLFGASLQKPFRNYLEGRRAKLHRRAGEPTPTDEEPLMAVGKVMIIMV